MLYTQYHITPMKLQSLATIHGCLNYMQFKEPTIPTAVYRLYYSMSLLNDTIHRLP